MDPQYQPVISAANFTTYTRKGFGDDDQIQLASLFGKLANRGCLLLLSNSDTPFIRRLYSDYSRVQRAINSKGSKRIGCKELLISHITRPPLGVYLVRVGAVFSQSGGSASNSGHVGHSGLLGQILTGQETQLGKACFICDEVGPPISEPPLPPSSPDLIVPSVHHP